MATQTLVVASMPILGASVSLVLDDVALKVTDVILNNPGSTPIVVTLQMGGQNFSRTVSPGTVNQDIKIPAGGISYTLATNWKGQSTPVFPGNPVWGISSE